MIQCGEAGGGVASKPWEGVCAGTRLLAQAWRPWLCLPGAPARSPQPPAALFPRHKCACARDARCRVRVRVRGAARQL